MSNKDIQTKKAPETRVPSASEAPASCAAMHDWRPVRVVIAIDGPRPQGFAPVAGKRLRVREDQRLLVCLRCALVVAVDANDAALAAIAAADIEQAAMQGAAL